MKADLRRYLAWPGAAYAIGSAMLFGASTPFAKLLLGQGVSPWLLAGILYLGSGAGLAVVYGVRRFSARPREASLRRSDLPTLALVILFGGVAGPVLLMLGLTTTPASTAALLLNVEGLATLAIAWIAFRENVDRRLLVGAAAILTGVVLLSWRGGPTRFGPGGLAVVGACIAWGIDNNLSRKLSTSDPVQLAMVKGLAAGIVNITLALSVGARWPAPLSLGGAAVLGFLSYGASLVFFTLGLRHLGAARTGAYFSTAPFLGAAVAIPLLGEKVTLVWALAGLLMAVGVYFHLTEDHSHAHDHEPLDHDHPHVHDAHHRHVHGPEDPPGEPHVHAHHHAPMRHAHAHYPDIHHRHRHADREPEARPDEKAEPYPKR